MGTPPADFVTVNSKEELDAALPWADQIVVEGDDELLSYAVSKAARDPANDVDINVAGTDTLTIQSGHEVEIATPELDHRLALRSHQARSERPELEQFVENITYPKRTRMPRAVLGLLAAMSIVLLAVGTIAYFPQLTPVQNERPSLSRGLPPGPGVDRPAIVRPDAKPVTPAPQQVGLASLLQMVVWPGVAIVAIIALFLIARQAIAGGRNVEFTWKLTEKVSGRVVITKSMQRSAARRKGS